MANTVAANPPVPPATDRRYHDRRQKDPREFKIIVWRIITVIMIIVLIVVLISYAIKGIVWAYQKIFANSAAAPAAQTQSSFGIGHDQGAVQNLTAPSGAVVSQFNIVAVPPQPPAAAQPVLVAQPVPANVTAPEPEPDSDENQPVVQNLYQPNPGGV